MAKGKAALRVVDLRGGDSEIEKHAVDLRKRKAGKDVWQFREPGAAENETGVGTGELPRCGFGIGVAVDADESPTGRKPRQDGLRVTAAAKRRIDVDAVRLDRQGSHRFFEQDGNMCAIGHEVFYRVNPSSSDGRPSAGNAMVWAVCACHCVSSHSSNLWPWPTITACLSRLA